MWELWKQQLQRLVGVSDLRKRMQTLEIKRSGFPELKNLLLSGKLVTNSTDLVTTNNALHPLKKREFVTTALTFAAVGIATYPVSPIVDWIWGNSDYERINNLHQQLEVVASNINKINNNQEVLRKQNKALIDELHMLD